MSSPDDYAVGSVWEGDHIVWLVTSSQNRRTNVARRPACGGQCVILGKSARITREYREYDRYPVGSTMVWDSELEWCKRSLRIA